MDYNTRKSVNDQFKVLLINAETTIIIKMIPFFSGQSENLVSVILCKPVYRLNLLGSKADPKLHAEKLNDVYINYYTSPTKRNTLAIIRYYLELVLLQ